MLMNLDNIYMNVGNARKSYNMKQMEYYYILGILNGGKVEK